MIGIQVDTKQIENRGKNEQQMEGGLHQAPLALHAPGCRQGFGDKGNDGVHRFAASCVAGYLFISVRLYRLQLARAERRSRFAVNPEKWRKKCCREAIALPVDFVTEIN